MNDRRLIKKKNETLLNIIPWKKRAKKSELSAEVDFSVFLKSCKFVVPEIDLKL